jgi:hypothetical protein
MWTYLEALDRHYGANGTPPVATTADVDRVLPWHEKC